ncbi:MAG: N-acetylmuramoyl-L-alanine amidase [Ferruginibacter sp.]
MKNICNILLFAVMILVCNACATRPFADTNKKYRKQARAFAKMIKAEPTDSISGDSVKYASYWIGTTNFGMRKPNYVIIHHTAQNSCEQTLQTFTLEQTQVSAHYVICKDGTLHHMLNNYLRAWHAGAAKWGNETDLNSSSIGIEIDNNGIDSFSEAQFNTLLGLLATLKKNYNIPAANFIGHGDIAPGRKVDPGINFPWKRFAENGYGLWYSDTTNVILPENFIVLQALRIVGYDVSNSIAAIQAFRRHFLQTEITGELTEPEKKVLYVLMREYM